MLKLSTALNHPQRLALAPVYSALIHGADNPTVVVGIIGMALIGKHWQNIQRLLAGQESKIGAKKKH